MLSEGRKRQSTYSSNREYLRAPLSLFVSENTSQERRIALRSIPSLSRRPLFYNLHTSAGPTCLREISTIVYSYGRDRIANGTSRTRHRSRRPLVFVSLERDRPRTGVRNSGNFDSIREHVSVTVLSDRHTEQPIAPARVRMIGCGIESCIFVEYNTEVQTESIHSARIDDISGRIVREWFCFRVRYRIQIHRENRFWVR